MLYEVITDEVGSFYAPDAVFQAANFPVMEGRQAILVGYRDFYATVLEMGGEVSGVVASESGVV